MNNRKNILLDFIVVGLLFLSLIVLLFPWQIILINVAYNNYLRLSLEFILILLLIYCFIRVKYSKKILKWAIRISIIPYFIYITSLVFHQIVFKPANKTTYSIFYTNTLDKREIIKICHYHGFLQNWNEIKHEIEYPKWGFRLESKFDLNNLEGEWYVHADNPYHQTEGLMVFKNGKEIKQNTNKK